jgi:hypothetical protein
MAEGPASSGTASGKMKGSRPLSVGYMPSPPTNTIFIAITSRITPPATSSERSLRRIRSRKPWPPTMKAISTAKAMATSRSATRVRRCGATPPSTEMKIGRLPNGSSTSSSRTKAERKLWSIGQAARRVAMAAVL